MSDVNATPHPVITIRAIADPVPARRQCSRGDGHLRTDGAARLQRAAAHSHSGNDEFIYVLEGTLRYRVGDEERDLSPGDHMFTPRGSVHAFSNPHSASARALVTNTPDIGAQYFKDVAALAQAGGPPDKARVAEVMARYGLRPALPAAAQS